jgi:hypothetical protein
MLLKLQVMLMKVSIYQFVKLCGKSNLPPPIMTIQFSSSAIRWSKEHPHLLELVQVDPK